jgi:hypothetical protein
MILGTSLPDETGGPMHWMSLPPLLYAAAGLIVRMWPRGRRTGVATPSDSAISVGRLVKSNL